MKIALIYPPTCDPTAPYLSVPMLTAFLRSNGMDVLPIDANVEAYDHLLRSASLRNMATTVVKRLKRLERKKALTHSDQLLYLQLWEAARNADALPEAVEDAVCVLRDRSGVRFFDPVSYEQAVQAIQAGLQVISAAYAPLIMDFTMYRTPFSLLAMDQIEADAAADRNPFHDYFYGDLYDRLASEAVDMVGISLAFPGQIQPGYALAYMVRQKMPHVHITAGGPAMTQLLVRLPAEKQSQVLGPFHSAVLYEGEETLLELARMIAGSENPAGILHGRQHTDPGKLPPPDFQGLPLEKYFSPEPVLPYDPTRGCYWGKCAFCHYGLSSKATAAYRERPVDQIVGHLKEIQKRWGCDTVYFSQDCLAPRTARKIAQALHASGESLRWGTDMRPEPELTIECCQDLVKGGALSMALGIESAAPRILDLIHKGIRVKQMKAAVKNLARAGIAVEAMCFTDFPGESHDEAIATLDFIQGLHHQIALFICGRFGLCHGARVARHPDEYGIETIWHVQGDDLQTGLFYQERIPSKTESEKDRVNEAIDNLSEGWWLHPYPWAGALSTAHTLLWYKHHGPDVFKRFAKTPRHLPLSGKPPRRKSPFDLRRMTQNASLRETEIWHELIDVQKAVTPERYDKCSKRYPLEFPKTRRSLYAAGAKRKQSQ